MKSPVFAWRVRLRLYSHWRVHTLNWLWLSVGLVRSTQSWQWIIGHFSSRALNSSNNTPNLPLFRCGLYRSTVPAPEERTQRTHNTSLNLVRNTPALILNRRIMFPCWGGIPQMKNIWRFMNLWVFLIMPHPSWNTWNWWDWGCR